MLYPKALQPSRPAAHPGGILTVTRGYPIRSLQLPNPHYSEILPLSYTLTRLEYLMKPRLLAISGTLTGTVQPLVDGRLSIGRQESNQLCLVDPVVSRQHCTIRQFVDGFELDDLDSHNGTFVNGIPIHRKIIAHGDTIRIGNSELVFLLHEGEVVPNSKISPHPTRTRLPQSGLLKPQRHPSRTPNIPR